MSKVKLGNNTVKSLTISLNEMKGLYINDYIRFFGSLRMIK